MGDIASQVLASTIECGSVYLFKNDNFVGDKAHNFVVLNCNPLESVTLLFACATSQVEKRRKRQQKLKLPESTLVEVKAGQISFLPRDTIFDCNEPVKYSVEAIIKQLQSGLFVYRGKLPDELIILLQNGVVESTQVDEETKDLLGLQE